MCVISAGALAEGKVAVLNLEEAVFSTEEAKAQFSALRQTPEYAKNKKEAETLKKQYEDLAEQFNKNREVMSAEEEAEQHQLVTQAVHAEGGKIAMQILHFGRYAYHPDLVAPSAIQAPISPAVPHELSSAEVEQTIADYARCAQLAQRAGYDGVEIMGSEGYLINEFIARHTNKRADAWGGSYACLLYTSPSPRDRTRSRMPSSA